MRVATKTISGLYDGATTSELDELSIQTAAALIVEEPQYAELAARLLGDLHREGGHATRTSTRSPSRSPPATALGLIADAGSPSSSARTRASSTTPIDAERDRAVRVLRPAHGLRPLPAARTPRRRLVIETPQHFFLRVACGLADDGRGGASSSTG